MNKQLKLKLKSKNPQTKIILGLVLFFVSIFLFISFNSFWWHWQADDDTIQSGWKSISDAFSNEAENILGWIGAYTSYFFIKYLGINAYSLIVIIFSLSIKLIFKLKFNYYQFLKNIIIIILWIAIFLGFSMQNLDSTGYTYGLIGSYIYNNLNHLTCRLSSSPKEFIKTTQFMIALSAIS